MSNRFYVLLVALALFLPTDVAPKALATDESAELMNSRFNIPIKTTGGTQLWTDHCDRDGYRIQQHAFTGHWRLLDADNVRQAWGDREACQRKLDEIRPKLVGSSTHASSHAIVMLHGLMRTRNCMKSLENEILAGDDHPDVRTIRFSYASTRCSIGEHAAALREVLEEQDATTQFSFVGHSMGNIVVRHLLGDLERDGDSTGILPRCRSMVMLGPPNQGAAIARRLAPTKLYGWITGTGGLELGPDWEDFSAKLATPPFPFLIIAGDVSDSKIKNPLVDGSGDFVVSLDEAQLDGAEGIETFPVLHSFLMSDTAVIERTLAFLASH
ncbi:Alpha/beta hydrolase family protein [Rubripirellula amarantea]|uniref:Alpha/beta hydrolase family protein n=1 Tax=Rubripirellula amarantea TaxID=2527999 RepID=A0A5C5WV76_9BACT|nr:alpha/beta hydrolase family protein [Rubripirellula amarantea]TWT53875.1 Alpha/beta hydrolase family protein [Rubripirellula amarantea]